MRNSFQIRVLWCAAMLAAAGAATRSQAATVPVTNGLITNLNSDSAGNFVLGGANEVLVWNDLATDGSNGSVQSFGNTSAANQPTFSTATMPNGLTMNVVNFVRGTVSATSANSATTSSDFLQSNAGGSNGEFAAGADPAYEVGGAEGPDGISWFAVFKSNITSVPTSGNQPRQARQNIVSSDYATTAGTFGVWNTAYSEDAAGVDPAIPDLYSGIREPSELNQVNNLAGDIPVSPGPQWFIAGESWDLDAGTADSRFFLEDGASRNAMLSGAAWTTSIGPHAVSWIGKGTTSTSTGQALDGDIAEILIYRTALTSTEVDAVMNYLKLKYFTRQPGDFDGDGDVDGADFVAWQTNFPKASGALLSEGDADGDGDVDGADFVVWQTNFPFTPGAGASPVPVPAACCLAVAGALMVFARCRPRRRVR